MFKRSAFLLTVIVVLVTGVPSAVAGWSAPLSVKTSPFGTEAVAVDARGDAAIAFAPSGSPAVSPIYRSSVTVWVRAASGHMTTHRVWSSSSERVDGLSVALDAQGQATVAWVSSTRHQQESVGGAGTVHAAYGTLTGRWAGARSIGRGLQESRLAVAPDGKVLLVWIARGSSSAQVDKVTVAWRAPGHAFGTPRALSSPRVQPVTPGLGRIGVIPSFDAHGSAYLAGECEAVVVSAPPHSHRFAHPAKLAQGPQLGVSFSVTGSGNGLASWAHGRCATDVMVPDRRGPVFASVMRAGRFGPVQRLSAGPADGSGAGTHALWVPGSGGTVTWQGFSARLGVSGVLGLAQPIIGDPLAPVAVDGGGDQFLTATSVIPDNTYSRPVGGYPVWSGVVVPPAGGGPDQRAPGVVVRPAGGRADQPAPLSDGLLAVASPVGRAALMVTGDNPLTLSVWRP